MARPARIQKVTPVTGATLPGMMIAGSIFVIVAGGIMSTHLFGLRLAQMGRILQGANEGHPRFEGELHRDLNLARSIYIGDVTSRGFREIASGREQNGGAMLLLFGSDTNRFVLYEVDRTDWHLKRTTETAGSQRSVVGKLSNRKPFTLEDFQGNALTNRRERFTLDISLIFQELPELGISIGQKELFKSYTYETKFTPNS